MAAPEDGNSGDIIISVDPLSTWGSFNLNLQIFNLNLSETNFLSNYFGYSFMPLLLSQRNHFDFIYLFVGFEAGLECPRLALGLL